MIEAKAKAAPVGSLAGAIVGVAGYLLGAWVFHGPVPDDVQQILLITVPAATAAAGAFLAAYRARHTHRPDLTDGRVRVMLPTD